MKTITCNRGGKPHHAEVPDTWSHCWCQTCMNFYNTARRLRTPPDGSNMEVAAKLIGWMREHEQKAVRITRVTDFKVFTIVARLPVPTGKSESNCVEIVFVAVGLNYERAVAMAPFKFVVLFAGEGRLPVVRGWTLAEYTSQYEIGVTYEDLEQETYLDPSNGKPDAVKGKKR